MFPFPGHASAANISGNETDKLALLAFKSLIKVDPLSALSSWNDTSSFCNWNGVKCGLEIPRLTALNLTGQRLSGFIPTHFGNFSFIETLDLSGNYFQGWIPSELSNCTNLRDLALDHNYLTGMVPFELGALSELTTLYLGSNNLSGNIPFSIGNLTSLREIDMSYNDLSGEFPSTMSRLRSLRTFRFSVNHLSGEFPTLLYNLTSLDFIALSFNNLTGNLRNDIGLALPNLRRIWLAYNFFTGAIPKSFSNASKLENIDIIRNNFTGKVPLSFAKLNLLSLNIGFNHLGLGEPDDLNFVDSLTNCTNLRFLHFGNNRFGGVLPVSIANLSTKLTTLYLQGNLIHGSIPRDISNLESLSTLYMNSNYLDGTIPDSFGMFPNLARVVLSSNRLTGKIPPRIGNMTHLIWLFLFDNRLDGEIPLNLANCKQLVFFSIAQNNFTGTIPHEIIGISSLLSFNASFNSFSGRFPENVGNLSGLVEIDLSYNKFSGEIPNSLGNCLALNIIFLQGNSFHGRVPFLARLSNLNYLDLSRNNLSGNIPDFLAKLPSLIYLNLSYNNLDGKIPSTGVFLNTSATDIRENRNLCANQETRKKRRGLKKKFKLVLIIVLTASLAAFSLFLLLICRIKKSRNKLPKSLSRSLANFYLKVSYGELLNATNGFSSRNLIGRGSFGTVYKGTLGSEGTLVAVKVLNLGREGAVKSFVSECRTLRNIRHHNLVKVITACSSSDYQGNDFKALVYQFMPNGSLDKWLHPGEEGDMLRTCSLSIVKRIDIAMDVASALHYLHHECQMPMVHCDLKPQNVLLDGDMMARVGDFGLARLVPKFDEQLSSIGFKGTIGYAAPEHGLGAQRSILGDVYSFGILLLEMFTGKRPTDDLFTENSSLHSFVKMAVPDRVVEILDNSALCQEVTGNAVTWDEGWSCLSNEKRSCLVYVLQIGVMCSSESPKDRMTMRQVCRELVTIRDTFLDAGFVKN
ncbi:probable LRR receptor-like serine/threonine-protein kinase at3g47570 [Phtheirospermum japonicum]|uniref:non-specific serine/threonine protein kinase n=1 Tax=Phtheirospermum japonicum TaxID=374723 RepID=A0A830BXC6_9LAMI|nr:probable LRR receptor-like serine/threonine-protein kinase at3g47570 [Phtheirospermum japonicum]